MSHTEEKYLLVSFAEMPFFETQFGCHYPSSLEVWGSCFSDYSLWGVIPGSTLCCSGSRLTRGSELPGASAFSAPYVSSAIVSSYSNWFKALYLQLCSCISSGGFLIKKAFTPEE